MSFLRIPTATAAARTLLVAAVLLVVAVAFTAATWAVGSALATRGDEREITDVGVWLSPGDALARSAHAAMMERAFDMESIAGSLSEYEAAVALSPHDFRLWLSLGRARERDGDRPGAETAYRRSLQLAPNYSRVHWALGNLLVRDGRADAGFAHIRTAAESDNTFAAPAVAAAWQAFAGDVARVTAALGEGDNTRVELARNLAEQKRFDEAVAIWSSVPEERRRTAFAEQGKALAQKTFEGGRFRLALSVANGFHEPAAEPDKVTNGGFESPIRPKASGPFDWKNVDGLYPQMGPTGGQKLAGEASLLVRFGDPTNLEFRSVSQTVAVQPGRRYALSLAHRSELKSQAAFRWEIMNAATGTRIAATEPLAAAKDWITSTVEFAAPADTDGVTLRLIRENCTAPMCTVAGTIWFDEFTLRPL